MARRVVSPAGRTTRLHRGQYRVGRPGRLTPRPPMRRLSINHDRLGRGDNATALAETAAGQRPLMARMLVARARARLVAIPADTAPSGTTRPESTACARRRCRSSSRRRGGRPSYVNNRRIGCHRRMTPVGPGHRARPGPDARGPRRTDARISYRRQAGWNSSRPPGPRPGT
ncbi:hypothetical protein FRAHR75_1160010 [Frankia sp. Hr75.2]|nr:hypothetical protein FRAHR75_1160010 [Frankia sp. Hr75.2]